MTFLSLIEIGKIARNTLKHNSDYINHISLYLFSFTSNTRIPAQLYATYAFAHHTRIKLYIHSLSLALFILSISPHFLLPFAPLLYHSFSYGLLFPTHPAYSNSYTHIPSRMAICHFDRKTSGGLY